MIVMKRLIDFMVDNVAAFENDAFFRLRYFKNRFDSSINSEPNEVILSISIITMTGITRLIDCFVVSGVFDENDEFSVIFYIRKPVRNLLKY
jgi:predicted ATP-dependent serine protease